MAELLLPCSKGTHRSLEKLRSKYYKKRGYDHNGIPTPKTLKRLGIQTLTGLQIPS